MTKIITVVSHYDIFLYRIFMTKIISMFFHYDTFLTHDDDNHYDGSSGGQLRVPEQPSKLLCTASPQVRPNCSIENHLILNILDPTEIILSAPKYIQTAHLKITSS